MDMETSLSQQVLAAIPVDGATWGDIKRQFPNHAPWTIEAALKAMLAARVLTKIVLGDTGIFCRSEFAPMQPKDDPTPRNEKQYEARKPKPLTIARETRCRRYVKCATPVERYDHRGMRFCTRGLHYLHKSQFGVGKVPDGLHSWCRKCKRDAQSEKRAAA